MSHTPTLAPSQHLLNELKVTVSDLKNRFNSAAQSQTQSEHRPLDSQGSQPSPPAAATKSPAFGSHVTATKPLGAVRARESGGEFFGVVLKPALPPRRGIDIDVNGSAPAGHPPVTEASLSPRSPEGQPSQPAANDVKLSPAVSPNRESAKPTVNVKSPVASKPAPITLKPALASRPPGLLAPQRSNDQPAHHNGNTSVASADSDVAGIRSVKEQISKIAAKSAEAPALPSLTFSGKLPLSSTKVADSSSPAPHILPAKVTLRKVSQVEPQPVNTTIAAVEELRATDQVSDAPAVDRDGVKFQKLPYVRSRSPPPTKPESLPDVSLPVLTWQEEKKIVKTEAFTLADAQRAVSLIAPTTEEEEYDEGSSVPMLPPALPPRAIPAAQPKKEVFAPAAVSEGSSGDQDNFYDDGSSTSKPSERDAPQESDEEFQEYDDVSSVGSAQQPVRSAAKTDSKEALKRQKEEDKLKAKKEKEEKREREKREKEEQKKEADLQKLLNSYKVTSIENTLEEATVQADYLRAGKNELVVRKGDTLKILAKDAKGKWLAKTSSGQIGIVSSSNVVVLGSADSGGSADDYDEADEVYAMPDD